MSPERPATLVLEAVGLNRSTYYNQSKASGNSLEPKGGRRVPGWSETKDGLRMTDNQVKQHLLRLIDGDGFYYGYHKLTHALRREFHLVINKKKVYRLCKELNALRPQRKLAPGHPRKLARNRVVTGSNQVWETDVKYGYVEGQDRFFYIASVLDVYDRSIVGCYVGLTCEARDILRTLKAALKERGIPGRGLILRSDNGPQFKSTVLKGACRALGVEQEYIPFKTPNLNAHIESFHSILEAECLAGSRFEMFGEAWQKVREYLDFYNNRRLHSSCGYRPPVEYYLASQRETERSVAIAI